MCVACMSVSFDLASGFQGSPTAQWLSALQSFLWLNPVPLCGCGGGVLSGETPGRRRVWYQSLGEEGQHAQSSQGSGVGGF